MVSPTVIVEVEDSQDQASRTPAALVTCHVEAPLNDAIWFRFLRLYEARTGGFDIVALMRPPANEEHDRENPWVERARRVERDGLLGHHTHFGGGSGARPPDPALAADRVRRERRWLNDRGLRPRFFCGGGWFMDRPVAAAVAEANYIDCTALSSIPSYITAAMPHLSATEPCVLILDDGQQLTELPTTHSLGMASRSLLRTRRIRQSWVHLYFHDWDLLNRRRAAALGVTLRLLGRRYRPFAIREFDPAVSKSWPKVQAREAMRP